MDRLIIGLIIALFAGCSSRKSGIELIILDKLICVQDGKAEYKVQLKNFSDTTFLLYAFEMTGLTVGGEDFFTKSYAFTSGTEMFLLDLKGNQLFPKIIDKDYNHMSFSLDTMDISLARTGREYRDKKVVLEGNSKASKVLSIELKHFDIKPGIYQTFIIYYSGKNLYNLVPEKEVREDEMKYGAIEFRGWLKSNTVKLVVK